jgi:hypothetical protein
MFKIGRQLKKDLVVVSLIFIDEGKVIDFKVSSVLVYYLLLLA